MKYIIKSDISHSIEIEKKSDSSNQFTIKLDDSIYDVQVKQTHPNGQIKTLIINNKVFPVEVLKHADGLPRTVYLNGLPFDVDVQKMKSLTSPLKPPDKKRCGDIKSSLPGQVLSVLVNKGDRVIQGQPVLILESMKMENEILATNDGLVKSILVKPGQLVMKSELLMQIS